MLKATIELINYFHVRYLLSWSGAVTTPIMPAPWEVEIRKIEASSQGLISTEKVGCGGAPCNSQLLLKA
jgi:hypothetical protein